MKYQIDKAYLAKGCENMKTTEMLKKNYEFKQVLTKGKYYSGKYIKYSAISFWRTMSKILYSVIAPSPRRWWTLTYSKDFILTLLKCLSKTT